MISKIFKISFLSAGKKNFYRPKTKTLHGCGGGTGTVGHGTLQGTSDGGNTVRAERLGSFFGTVGDDEPFRFQFNCGGSSLGLLL